MSAEEDFTMFVRARSSALLRSAYLLTAGDLQAGEDLVQSALGTRLCTLETYSRSQRHRCLRQADSVPYGHTPEPAEGLNRAVDSGAVEDGHSRDFAVPQDAVTERLSIWPLLQGLSAQQRAVVVLRYYEDLTEEQIADVLGCAPGTVKSHANRALRSLRTSLKRSDNGVAGTSERSGR